MDEASRALCALCTLTAARPSLVSRRRRTRRRSARHWQQFFHFVFSLSASIYIFFFPASRRIRNLLISSLLCAAGAADYIKGSVCGNNSCSPSSENPYATIREPPGLTCKHGESSYVEMKSPSHREVPFGGTATLLGSAGRNLYDVGECVVALMTLVPGRGTRRLTPTLAGPL